MRIRATAMKSWIVVMGVLACGLFGVPAVFAQQSVCLQCHQGQSGRLQKPVPLWENSIHAGNGISCHECHGGDPTDFVNAMSPERGFIGVPLDDETPEFCGRCHVGILEDYQNSAHGQALGRGGPHCVTCHNSHDVKPSELDLINSAACSLCHAYNRAEEIKTALSTTDTMIVDLGEELESLRRLGFTTKQMRGELFSARNQFHRLFHTVNVDRLRKGTGAVHDELGKIRAQIEGIEGRLSQRRIWGGVAVGLLILCGSVFLLMRKTYEEEEEER